MDLVNICGQSFFEIPVSGGGILNFEFLKGANSKKTYLIINNSTANYARKILSCHVLPIIDIFNLNIGVRKHLWLVPAAFFNSVVMTILILKRFKRSLLLYSGGDFICNIIPMVLYKKWYQQSKIIVRIHHINEDPFKRKGNFFLASYVSFIFQRTSFFLIKKYATLVILLNDGVKQDLIKLGFQPEKLTVLGAGIDFEEIGSVNENKRKNIIVFFARLSKTKGLDDLPKIFKVVKAKFPDIKLIIIGGGDEGIATELREKFVSMGYGRDVDVRGYIEDKQEIYKIMKTGKIYVLPSYEEGWAMTILEAIACGLAPVVYDLPVFKEIYGGKIISAPIGDSEYFSQKIIYLLDNEEKRQEYNQLLNHLIRKYSLKKAIRNEHRLIYALK